MADPLLSRLKTMLDYVDRFGLAGGVAATARIIGTRALRVPFTTLPIPGSRERFRVRTRGLDVRVFNQIFVWREYDIDGFEHAKGFERALREPLLVVDCGANIGCSAVWFARRYPRAKVVAVEPEGGNFEQLAHNAHRYPNIEPLRAAVWNSRTEVVIANPQADSWGYRTASAPSALPSAQLIPTVTLDEILARHATSRTVIVKIDIEGAETGLFAENTGWLERVDLLIIELHDWMLPWKQSARPVLARLSGLPMDFVSRGENLFCFRHPREEAAAREPVPSVLPS
jgi:FkbM family methyltransferase